MTTTHYHVTFTSDAEPPTDADITNLVGRMLSFTRWPQRDVAVRVLEPDEANATEQLALAMRRIDLLTGDLELIGNALKDEAVRRDWCAEYEAFVDEVNACTKAWDLPTRRRDYRVEHVYEVRIIGTVSAISDEDADIEAARQYGQIRESYHFLLPTDQELLPDRGQLYEVTWHHEQSTTTPEED
jgi:hypothetical protein